MRAAPFGKLRRRITRFLKNHLDRSPREDASPPGLSSPIAGAAEKLDGTSADESLTDVASRAARIEFETRARAQSKAVYLGDNICLCRVLGEALIYVDTRDYGIAPHLMMSGFWESWVSVAMMSALKPGMTAVDVGANVGYYTLLMGLAVRPNGAVYALEPNPHLTKWLERSLLVSGTHRITTIDGRAAFSESARKMRLFVPAGFPMNGSILDEGYPLPGQEGELVEVTTVRLDDALPEKVDFIKIDAEGAEREIWRGMGRLVAANRDMRVFMEFNAARRYDPREFLAQIRNDGFRLGYVAREGLKKSADAAEILAQQGDVMLYLTR